MDALRIEERVDVVDRLGELAHRATVYTLSAPDIRETAGAFENVLHVLQLLPGVAATNDEDGKLAVRGAGPKHNLLVVDGIAIHSPQRFGDFTSSFLNPATAASVTLDPSGLSARHGGRLSSVTSIETRDGSRDRKLGVSGSLGLVSGDVLLEGRLPGTQSGSWWATARGTYYRTVLKSFNNGTMPGFGDVQFKVSAQPSPKTRLSVFGLAGRESMNQFDFKPDGQEQVMAQLIGISRSGVMNLSWTPTARSITTTTLSAYAHDARDHDLSHDFGDPPWERELSVDDFAARQRAVFALSARHVLDLGVDAHRIRSSWRMSGFKPPEFPRGLGPSTWGEGIDQGLAPLDARLRRTAVGTWVQDRFPLGSNWVAEPGVRLDWNSFTGEAVVATARSGLLVRAGQRGGVGGGLPSRCKHRHTKALQGFDYFHLHPRRSPTQLRNERSRQVVAGFESIADSWVRSARRSVSSPLRSPAGPAPRDRCRAAPRV